MAQPFHITSCVAPSWLWAPAVHEYCIHALHVALVMALHVSRTMVPLRALHVALVMALHVSRTMVALRALHIVALYGTACLSRVYGKVPVG